MDYMKEKKELFLMRQIYVTIMSLSRKLDMQYNKNTNNLTARQYQIILAIRLSPQRESTMVSIAKKLGTTKQNTAQLLFILERKGYVSKSMSEDNKREIKIQVTDSGLNAMLEYAQTDAAVMTEIFDELTEDEMEALRHLLKKLHCYDGDGNSDFEFDAYQLFENEYCELLIKILDEYKKRKC